MSSISIPSAGALTVRMKLLQVSLHSFIYCTRDIFIHAAFLPTSLPNTNSISYRDKLFFNSRPLRSAQDALPDLTIDEPDPIFTTSNKVPSPPIPPPFDPTNSTALIAITKSFIASDFGIQSTQLPSHYTASEKLGCFDNEESCSDTLALPYYSSSLLSNDFIWISSNNLNDGRAGILTKKEYLAAGRYFNLRKSFPDLKWRAHDFRVFIDEAKEYQSNLKDDASTSVDEITVRFTTLAVGTFCGAPLRLRSKVLEPNSKVMRCPPTSISITYAARGKNAGKIIKLVNDMVMDRQFGNTNGLSGIAGAAVVAGAAPSDWEVYPPLISVRKIFARPIKMIQEKDEDDGYMPPFPDSVIIQLAKGVIATNFGLDEPDLLSTDFSYIDPLMGPINKGRYIDVFSSFNVRDVVSDLDYQFQNLRIDPYNPYRVYVDMKARGTRTSAVGKNVACASSKYFGPPESMSFTFNNDGFCTRITGAALLDPLLGNNGLLGGIYGLLYAADTPENPLKTRTLNLLLNRAQKAMLKPITKVGIDEFRLSDGRIISGNKPMASLPALSVGPIASNSLDTPPKLTSPQQNSTPKIPFFVTPAANPNISSSTMIPPEYTTANNAISNFTLDKSTQMKTLESKRVPPKSFDSESSIQQQISDDPQDYVTDAFSSFFGTSEVTLISSTQSVVQSSESVKSNDRVKELKTTAVAAQKEALEAKYTAQQKVDEEKISLEEKKVPPPFSPRSATQVPSITPKPSPTLSFFDAKDYRSSGQINSTPLPEEAVPRLPAKTSPTFSMFGSLSASSPPKLESKSPLPAPEVSPQLSLFGSSTTSSSSLRVLPKKSPTLSLFEISSKSKVLAPSKATKKVASKGAATKKSQTFSIAGIGGDIVVTKKKAKGGNAPKKSAVKNVSPRKSKEKKAITKIPLFTLFPMTSESSDTSKKSQAYKPAAVKLPIFSLLPGDNKNNDIPVQAKAPKTASKRSPTLSLFGEKSDSSASTKAVPIMSKSKQVAKPSSSGGSLFEGFLIRVGGGGSSSISSSSSSSSSLKKESNDQSKRYNPKTSPLVKESSPAKGQPSNIRVPTLAEWKVNPDNSIEARIYRSSSFEDGTIVTTSPIGKQFKIAEGNVVQTSSGSRYLLS